MKEGYKMSKPDFYKELPIGLAMSLGMNEFAMDFYSTLDPAVKGKLKEYVQHSETGEEARKKIKNAVKNLENHDISFLE